MTTLDLIVPTCWQELSQQQLRYLCFLLSQGYDATTVKTYALMRFAKVDVRPEEPGIYTVTLEGSSYRVSAEQVAEVLPALDWVTKAPLVPVRLSTIGKRQAINAGMVGLSLYNYMALETLYQMYLATNQGDCIDGMAAILYDPDGLTAREHPDIKLSQEERISITLWYSAVKNYLTTEFSTLFQPSSGEPSSLPMSKRLQTQFDTMVRALTKGDITKEREILDMDMYRAFTELNAQAEEYEEIKKIQHK